MDLRDLSLIKIRELVLTRRCKIYDIVIFYKEIYEANKDINGYIEFFDDALELAKKYDGLLDRGEGQDLPLIGIPIAVKDNISIKNKSLTCASEILQGYVSPYDATVIRRLRDNGAIFIGRTNMDEFAMGSSCEFSYYGVTLNPLNKKYVVGGSSGGSGAVVANNQAPFALGSDTGGSVRIPASFANLIGFKPSYGGLSRYGLVSYASSLDQIGFFASSIDDVALILRYTCGIDRMDATSIDILKSPYPLLSKPLSGIKLAAIKELDENLMEPEVACAFALFKSGLLNKGVEIHEVSIEEINVILSLYYSVSPVEAASNLARYTCLHYGKRLNDDLSLDDFYYRHRSIFLREEVKRRIALGNYLLSEGDDLKYYAKACKIIENLLVPKFNAIFSNYAYIVTPTSLVKPFKIGENFDDPIKMYYSDLCTVIANLIGAPALSIPFAKDDKGLPIGMQIIGQVKRDFELLNFAKNVIEELR
ncbi:Asp-tRNA(Asn)/Glu-tRNA(Gln) amidotransferase subunit GatA [Borrelia miyamotoi]|uniref:Glutamyl-tRNA(Gln) amidotransferase subunit A n=1 Tax=Borrelia miyamotoi TaxID=47466 RepID=A0AAQ2X0U5_9SPIR|nr:Asp-tRNA(Asn)/Glu-tRNA(Gln) amidotransferase subunit GatA [Borrelia miyamotoi]AJA58949.1 glutamyl-tRNA amidotransferase [Borrelia miyamotoi]AOW96047.1 glutaminyl-tRNA synthase (glutamine-hydrolyzing) subunit A [Borrelia miyamotoi]QTL83476.1 Asp-tRNA(Asn)/Glu-tRNA(Gln) amidotransferase subunit GatA [Borrelia miyamotoi]WAZ85229.1 Asp-tRNA(Asn)/Glu-tRNA(Gln) amidotransferase subunit GatA [Borrelia miyamotoi]WAZ91013.1 Asp-tRNA(Asn)/Glu-tRNA(Gln) amidotransferase subunit GatA [Borrelia miyamoto